PSGRRQRSTPSRSSITHISTVVHNRKIARSDALSRASDGGLPHFLWPTPRVARKKNELTRPYPSPTRHPVCDGTGGGFVSSRASSLWVLSRYGLAVILAGLAFLTSLGMAPHWSQHHLLLPFYPAVILSAWFGGFGAGLLTTLLSGVAITSLYLSPAHSLTIRDPGDLVGVLLFVSVGLLVSAMNARLLDAQCRAESVARELRREIEERRSLGAGSAELTPGGLVCSRELHWWRNDGAPLTVFASIREADGLVEGIVIDITDHTGAEAVDQRSR